MSAHPYYALSAGLSLLRPMYYEYPTAPEAMTYTDTQVFEFSHSA